MQVSSAPLSTLSECMTNLAGLTDTEVRLWNTYLFWARSALPLPLPTSLHISSKENRLDLRRAQALQAIVLSAFALEYRIKRVFDIQNVAYDAKVPLGLLLSEFQEKLEKTNRLDDGNLVQLPREWARLYNRLKRLKDLRNNIAHAKFAELR
jgi:hypothetical protein